MLALSWGKVSLYGDQNERDRCVYAYGLPYRRNKKRGRDMEKHIKVWYDAEGDYLEVLFEKKAGFFKETENDAVMEKVDDEGKIIGFSILNFIAIKRGEPISISLKA